MKTAVRKPVGISGVLSERGSGASPAETGPAATSKQAAMSGTSHPRYRMTEIPPVGGKSGWYREAVRFAPERGRGVFVFRCRQHTCAYIMEPSSFGGYECEKAHSLWTEPTAGDVPALL